MNFSDLSTDERIVRLAGTLTASQRKDLGKALANLRTIDVIFRCPVGSFETSYQESGRELLAEVVAELRSDYPENPEVQALIEDLTQDLPRSR